MKTLQVSNQISHISYARLLVLSELVKFEVSIRINSRLSASNSSALAINQSIHDRRNRIEIAVDILTVHGGAENSLAGLKRMQKFHPNVLGINRTRINDLLLLLKTISIGVRRAQREKKLKTRLNSSIWNA
jgi:hypothetical protein